MKKFKKLAGLMLALVMVMGLSLTASAANYTITINNTTSGHAYEAYQIFEGTLSGTGSLADPYILTEIEWGSGVNTTTEVDGSTLIVALKALQVNGSNPFASCATAEDVAEVLGADGNNTADSDVAKAFADLVGSYYLSTTYTGSTFDTNYTIEVSEPGYYLVKDEDDSLSGDDAYTRFLLLVVGDVTATQKSSTPEVTKKVYDSDYTGTEYGQGYNDVADYSIGDDVQFKLTGTMPSNIGDYDTYKYIFHDTMSSGLTFNEDVAVTIGTQTVAPSYYTVTYTGSTLTDGCTFEISFNDILSMKDTSEVAISISSTSTVVVTYTAELNSSAVIGLSGNENEVKLEYSNNPNSSGDGDTGTTPEDKVIVFTYELDVTKADNEDLTATTTNKLKDAEFKLYKMVGSTKTYVQVDATGIVTGWTTTEADASTLTSDDDGFFKIVGLDDGTYYLNETKAPTGYNSLSGDIELTITATTYNGQSWSGTASDALTALTITVGQTTSAESITDGTVSTTVVNQAGASLPSTGGIGTTIFYVVGGLLVFGAVVMLITRRRMSKAE